MLVKKVKIFKSNKLFLYSEKKYVIIIIY